MADLRSDRPPAAPTGGRGGRRPLAVAVLVAVLLAVAGVGAPPAGASHFSDVPAEHPFHPDIAWLVANGVTGGFADGTFDPTRAVSRQSMAAFLYRLANPGSVPPECDLEAFPDVPLDHPFCSEIAWLVGNGITGGFADGTFRPTAPVSRQSMAAFLYRWQNPGAEASSCLGDPFPDVAEASPFCVPIAWLVGEGITTGFADGGFHPTVAVSRQSMAAFLHRLVGDVVVRASITWNGFPANHNSVDPVVSDGGRYVAFTSVATNVAPADANGTTDVFRRDLFTGATLLVSAAGGGTGNLESHSPSMSATGAVVAFASRATDLVGGDVSPRTDVYVRNLSGGPMTRVTVSHDGADDEDAFGHEPSISATGGMVAFTSSSAVLIDSEDDTDLDRDVFVRDLGSGTTKRLSSAPGGAESNGESFEPSISADGRYVVFRSSATDLVPDDDNGEDDVFRADVQSGAIELVSVGGGGVQGTSNAVSPSVSGNGQLVVFSTLSSYSGLGDTNGTSDVFVRNMVGSGLTRVSVSSDEAQGNGPSDAAVIAADGRFVAFQSFASNLVDDDDNLVDDVFVRDLLTTTTERVSVGIGGTEADSDSGDPDISDDGAHVAFWSFAENLVLDDTNGRQDIFRWARPING